MNRIKEYTNKVFEDIKHIDENGNEYWLARELQVVFKYTQWRRFENVIEKAKVSCKNSNINIILKLLNSGMKKNSQLIQDLLCKVNYSTCIKNIKNINRT